MAPCVVESGGGAAASAALSVVAVTVAVSVDFAAVLSSCARIEKEKNKTHKINDAAPSRAPNRRVNIFIVGTPKGKSTLSQYKARSLPGFSNPASRERPKEAPRQLRQRLITPH